MAGRSGFSSSISDPRSTILDLFTVALRRRRGCHAHEEFAIGRSGGGEGSWHRAKLTRQTITPWLIHGGTALQQREKATVLPWNDLSQLIGKIAS